MGFNSGFKGLMNLQMSGNFFFSKNTQTSDFTKNSSSGSRGVPCRRTEITELVVAFRNFVKALRKGAKENIWT